MEAISHLRQGLALLQTLPETPERTQREVDMLYRLGCIADCHAKATQLLKWERRTRVLGSSVNTWTDPTSFSPCCVDCGIIITSRAELSDGARPGRAAPDPGAASPRTLPCSWRRTVPWGRRCSTWERSPRRTRTLTQGMALYDPQQHRASAFLYGDDAGVVCHSFAAWTLWYLGYPDQGLARSHEAVTLAQQIAHPFSLGFALSLAAIFHQFRREVRCTQEHAEAAISLATEQGFPYWRAHGCYPTRLGAGAAGTGAGRDRADPPGLESLSCHRSRDSTTVFSGAPRRSTWNDRSSQRQDSRCSRKR